MAVTFRTQRVACGVDRLGELAIVKRRTGGYDGRVNGVYAPMKPNSYRLNATANYCRAGHKLLW